MNFTRIRNQSPLQKNLRTRWMHVMAHDIALNWRHKFEAGRVEHPESDIGELTFEQLIDEMENEALDQLSYVLEIKRRLADNKRIDKYNEKG